MIDALELIKSACKSWENGDDRILEAAKSITKNSDLIDVVVKDVKGREVKRFLMERVCTLCSENYRLIKPIVVCMKIKRRLRPYFQ